jgi:hypothetical protein
LPASAPLQRRPCLSLGCAALAVARVLLAAGEMGAAARVLGRQGRPPLLVMMMMEMMMRDQVAAQVLARGQGGAPRALSSAADSLHSTRSRQVAPARSARGPSRRLTCCSHRAATGRPWSVTTTGRRHDELARVRAAQISLGRPPPLAQVWCCVRS